MNRSVIPLKLRRSYWFPRLRDRCWRYLSPAWELPSGVKLEIRNESDWITFGDLFLNCEYDEAIDCAIKGKKNGLPLNVIDLGANVGFFYLRFLDRLAFVSQDLRVTFTAIEPNPECFERLNEVVRSHQSPLIEVNLLEGVVGRKSGSAEFEVSSFHIGSKVVDAEVKTGISVPYIDIQEHVPNREIDLLKIDIEGSEEVFLQENVGILDRCSNVIVEIHSDRCDPGRCRELILGAGLIRKSIYQSTEHFTVELYGR